jgi:hypothetical protein
MWGAFAKADRTALFAALVLAAGLPVYGLFRRRGVPAAGRPTG